MEDCKEHKKAKGTNKCVIKRELIFENFKNYLFNDEIILNSEQRFKSGNHKVYTEEVNKITLNSNDYKRLQTFDKITTYPYGTNTFKVLESEMMIVRDYFVENYADWPFYDEIKLQQRKYKWLILMITQTKTKRIIMKIGEIFQTIHTKY